MSFLFLGFPRELYSHCRGAGPSCRYRVARIAGRSLRENSSPRRKGEHDGCGLYQEAAGENPRLICVLIGDISLSDGEAKPGFRYRLSTVFSLRPTSVAWADVPAWSKRRVRPKLSGRSGPYWASICCAVVREGKRDPAPHQVFEATHQFILHHLLMVSLVPSDGGAEIGGDPYRENPQDVRLLLFPANRRRETQLAPAG